MNDSLNDSVNDSVNDSLNDSVNESRNDSGNESENGHRSDKRRRSSTHLILASPQSSVWNEYWVNMLSICPVRACRVGGGKRR